MNCRNTCHCHCRMSLQRHAIHIPMVHYWSCWLLLLAGTAPMRRPTLLNAALLPGTDTRLAPDRHSTPAPPHTAE